MTGMEWILEFVLVGLLIATVFHAVRLERALGVLKRDRAALEALVSGFNAATGAAEKAVDRLREATEGAGRRLARQVEAAARLKDDLLFLSERGGAVADRLDGLVRGGRVLAGSAPPVNPASRSHLRAVDPEMATPDAEPNLVGTTPPRPSSARPRSQAERDLIHALRLAR